MSISALSALKKSSSLANLVANVEKTTSPQSSSDSYKDDRFWKLTIDSSGNGSAVIRFLDRNDDTAPYFVRTWSHFTKGPTGRWYAENSLTSIGQQDYIAEQNKLLWETEIKANQDIVRKRKRKTNYFSNILVINDPAAPENNGKVFLFKYGVKIFDMITKAIKPPFPDMPAVNPFDFWEGANFRIRLRQDGEWPTFVDSVFDMPSALFGNDDEKIEAMWKQQYDLNEMLDPKNFKSYDELKKNYLAVFAPTNSVGSAESYSAKYVPEEEDVPLFQNAMKNDPVVSKSMDSVKDAFAAIGNGGGNGGAADDDDDDMAYFKSLANS